MSRAADHELAYVDEEGEEEVAVETGLTANQGRVLYLISLYSKEAKSGDDHDEWIRRQACLVLLYEGIVAEVFDYDYAPSSDLVEGRRRYFNKTQEGATDLDFLREEELLNGLKLASKAYQPVTCYQISKKGKELVQQMSREDRDAVHELVFAPGTRELLRVEWRGEAFVLVGPGGYERVSTVTDCEDVSYVSSAYIPQCLRFGGRPTLSNAHRAGQCAVSASNIRDDLDEVITLNSVSIVVSEWVPTGTNQLVQLNSNLGATERVRGGFYSALLDDDPAGTKFVVEPGLTAFNILDYSLTRHCNFEADIHIPEDEGIVQVETFGVSVNADGTVFYGMQIEAVMDRVKDNISLDHLSRLLVDVATDSSTVVDNVISPYQRRLLYLIFNGDAEQRDKVNLILANEINPHLAAVEYMDHGDFENELKQVIGDVRAAFDISDQDTIIFGESGMLVVGPNSRSHEPLLCSFMQFAAMDLFVRNFWNRMFIVKDDMREIRHLLNTAHESPQRIDEIRHHMQQLSDDVRLLKEVLGYLGESIDNAEVPPQPDVEDEAGQSLFEKLQIADLAGQLAVRVRDLRKNVEGAEAELKFLRTLSDQASGDEMLRTQRLVEYQTHQLTIMNHTNERVAVSMEIVQLVLAAFIAFAILDRLTGDWTVMDSAWMQDFANPMIKKSPLLWFIFNMIFWAVTVYGINRLMQYRNFRDQGRLTTKIQVNQKILPDRFNLLLASRATSLEDRQDYGDNHIIRATWDEEMRDWAGAPPTVAVEYDAATSFLYNVYITYNKRAAKKDQSLPLQAVRNRIADDFRQAGVFEDAEYSMVDSTKELTEEQLRALAAEVDDQERKAIEEEAAAAAGRVTIAQAQGDEGGDE